MLLDRLHYFLARAYYAQMPVKPNRELLSQLEAKFCKPPKNSARSHFIDRDVQVGDIVRHHLCKWYTPMVVLGINSQDMIFCNYCRDGDDFQDFVLPAYYGDPHYDHVNNYDLWRLPEHIEIVTQPEKEFKECPDWRERLSARQHRQLRAQQYEAGAIPLEEVDCRRAV